MDLEKFLTENSRKAKGRCWDHEHSTIVKLQEVECLEHTLGMWVDITYDEAVWYMNEVTDFLNMEPVNRIIFTDGTPKGSMAQYHSGTKRYPNQSSSYIKMFTGYGPKLTSLIHEMAHHSRYHMAWAQNIDYKTWRYHNEKFKNELFRMVLTVDMIRHIPRDANLASLQSEDAGLGVQYDLQMRHDLSLELQSLEALPELH